MSTLKISELRRRGLIPAKQHDAFLLALLLAVLINVVFFAIQALLPKLALLFTLLGINPPPPRPDEEKQIPFVLVDPSFLDEEVRTDLPPDAEGTVGREARQTEETPDLPEETAYRDEGMDIILTAPEGNPGLEVPAGNADEDMEQPAPAEPPSEAAPEPPPEIEEVPEQPEPQPEPEPAPEPEPVPEPEPLPEPQPEPEPLPEPDVPDIDAEPPEAEPVEEHSEEVLPEPPPEFTRAEAEPEAPRPVDPLDDIIDLAALPVTPEGFVDTTSRELERIATRPLDQPRPPPRERPRPERQEQVQPEPPARPQPPVERPEAPQPRPDRPQPVFKKIGGESSASGAPPRRSTDTAVKLIGEDASMRILQHRWGPYMAKVARQLQESLNRQMILSPTIFSTGQVRIRFGIAPDGTLSFQETLYVQDGMESARLMSEQTVKEAAPFDPLTPEMQKDENFQNMTVMITLY